MPWVKLDDRFHANPKVLQVGLAADGLYARALSYCGAYLTDGFVPRQWVLAQIGPDDEYAIVDKLVDAGLFVANGMGYVIHDYLKLNPSKSEIEQLRRAKSEGGRKGATQRWQSENRSSDESSDESGEAEASPTPIDLSDAPEPVPEPQGSGSGSQLETQSSPPPPSSATTSSSSDEPPGRQRWRCEYVYPGGVPCEQTFPTQAERDAHVLALGHEVEHELDEGGF